LDVKYLNLFNAGGLAFTPASADTEVDSSDSHLHSPIMYLSAARSNSSISGTSNSFASVGYSKVALAGSGLNVSHSGIWIQYALHSALHVFQHTTGKGSDRRKLLQVAVEVKKRWQNASVNRF